MRTVILDKIASVTANCHLRRDVKVGNEFPCQEGDVVAVRILNAKSAYNTLELTTGRMSALKPGDVIAGALGHRSASQGHAGHLPLSLAVGEELHVLNLGGVLGVCTSSSPTVGPPFVGEVLGQVLHFPYFASRVGVPANIGQGIAPLDQTLSLSGTPVVAVVGTSMNSGKTEACTVLIQGMVRAGLSVAAAKATGVSLQRDVLGMQDAGASRTAIFTEYGVVTTTDANAPALARSMLNALAADSPDVIILELGDGLLGGYGVGAILDDADLRSAFAATVLAASDPVGAWGGVELLSRQWGLTPSVVTGPATDNAVGSRIIQTRTSVRAANARQEPSALIDHVLSSAGVTARA